MTEIHRTEDQQAAVAHRGSALLVSAAAGSGKTKVLVDRLLERICDPVSPCNVDDFLIITYTRAAAAELRGKIARAVSERLAENPESRHLRSQLSRIYLAEISTVHAFCAGILRNYAYLLDIPADFRIAEEAECVTVRERAMQNVLAAGYEAGDSPSFTAFFETLGFGRDDRGAAELILRLYEKAQSHAKPEAWLREGRTALRAENVTAMEQTVWGRYLLDDTAEFLREHQSALRHLLTLASDDSMAKYRPVLEDDLAQVEKLLSLAGWNDFSAFPLSFARMPVVRSCADPKMQNQIKNLRGKCKDQLRDRLSLFSASSEQALTEIRQMSVQLEGLFDLTEAFGREYALLKRRRRILDFSDLEHFAVRLLTDSAGNPTEAARTVSERFTEILVDEYQDSNAVQDTIFRAVSKNGQNLFFVGDVKQSIYRFRLADPGIFLQKYRTYRERTEDSDGPVKILLNANFRSRPEILEAVNFVCSAVMSERVGDLAYTEAEMLRTVQTFPAPPEPPVELHILRSSVGDGEQAPDKTAVEAKFVASRISELLSTGAQVRDGDSLRPVRPEDIVILLRSAGSTAPVYQRALTEAGIPVQSDRGGSILETTEVRTVIGLLRVLQNPHQDIPLLSVLAGPVGGFSAEELAELRVADKASDCFGVLSASESPKAKTFLALLTKLRKMRRWMDLPHLLEAVYAETDLLTVFGASADGVQRCANLRQFRALCVSSAEQGVRSLHDLVLYLDDLDRQKFELPSDRAGACGGVSIMTVHKSKGLEFPVVFLSSLSHEFNTDDLKKPVLTDPELLVACSLVNRETMVSCPGTVRSILSRKMKRELLSEELRVLYVAMTRAKDRLILTYCAANAERDLQRAAESASFPVLPMIAGSVNCPGQWILLAAASRPEAQHLFGGSVTVACPFRWRVEFHEGTDIAAPKVFGSYTDAACPVSDRVCLDHSYDFAGSTCIPAKLTATQLKGRNLDEESAEHAETEVRNRRPHIRNAALLSEKTALSATERGTALHKFLQFCDYAVCRTEEGFLSERERLREKEFLSPEEADCISPEPVVRFFRSELGQEILQSKDVHREFKFSVLTDAGAFYPEGAGEEILMQGVVDCFLLRDDGITVLDYKTDRIRPGSELSHAETYRPQIMAYAAALEKIYERPVVRRIVYFFTTGTAVEL